MLSRDRADIVEPVDPDHLLVRGDLENGIGGGVENRFAGANVLGAQLRKNRGAALRVVADELHSGVALDGAHQVVGKALEGGEWFFENNTRDFPMAGSRVLARGAFLHFPVAALVGRDSVEPPG